jgi:hypothetical protein
MHGWSGVATRGDGCANPFRGGRSIRDHRGNHESSLEGTRAWHRRGDQEYESEIEAIERRLASHGLDERRAELE